MTRKTTRRSTAAWGLLTALAVMASLTGCDDKVERTIGDMAAASIEAEFSVVDDPLLSEWIRVLGHTLVGYTMRQDIPYTFKVLDTDMVNAFAAPYGHIYVTTGLLDFAESEDEVCAVLAHEIGHVVHRHSMSSLKRGLLYEIGLAILGRENRTLADIAGVGLGLLSLRYSRSNEYEADDMGSRLAFAAGYDPRGNADFFEHLRAKYEKSRPSSIEVMFRTHPPSQNRADRQRAMPELSDQNPDALLKTGRGYARRYQLRRAAEAIARASELRPNDPVILLALADVQLQRGSYQQARLTFERLAQLRPRSLFSAHARLASAGALSSEPPASGDEQGRAAAALTSATNMVVETEKAVRDVETRASALDTRVAATIAGTHSILDQLFGLAERETKLDGSAQDLLAFANAAINKALDPVYSVERQRELLLVSARQLQSAGERIVAKLGAAERGQLPAPEVSVLERCIAEWQRGLRDIRAALTELERAEPAVRAAQQSASEATELVDRIMRGDKSQSTAERARSAAQLTQSRALTALAVTRKAKELVDRSTVRSLVVRINVAGAGVSPQDQRNLDGLVGHFVMNTPQQVAKLREEGMGYGDAALLLASARGLKQEPTELVRLASGAASLVDQLSSAGAQVQGATVLLKYMARAIEYETGS